VAETVNLKALAPLNWTQHGTDFVPCARFYEDMDVLLYLEEDIAYRADRVDSFLTLLWHPDKEEAIGVKLKGFRFLFQRLQSILRSDGVKLGDEKFVPMISALEVALTAGLGSAITADAEHARRVEEKYEKARRLIDSATFDTGELVSA